MRGREQVYPIFQVPFPVWRVPGAVRVVAGETVAYDGGGRTPSSGSRQC